MEENLLEIEPEKEVERIKEFIKEGLERLKKEGVVIGLSGGLDSSTVAFLAKEALGREKIFTLILPERDSASENIENARKLVKKLNLENKEIDLTPFFEKFGVYDLSVEKIPQNRKLIENF